MHYQKRVRELRGELHGEQACVKLTTSPKDFEAQLEESLVYTICEDDGPGSDCEKYFLNQSRHNILLMCVYSDTEGLFRWGVVTKKFAETHLMTSTAIAAHWQAINAGGNLSHGVGVDGAMGEMDVKEAKLSGHSQVQTCIPVCRAFFKLSEIVSNMLPRWGWNWPDKKTCISIDVGASPGGWTQSLSNISYGVVAIDPGLLRDDIVALPNVIHIKDRVENESVQTILQSLTSSNCAKDVDYIFGLGDPNSSSTKVVNSRELLPKISAVVCDMNMDARDAVRLLRQHVLCFIPGFLRRTPYCDQCSESAEQLARNQAQGLHNEMAGESVPNIRIDGVPSQSWCDMHGDNGLKHDEERIPRTSRENGLELAGDLEEVEHAIVVVTLKLCKNPKQHHIDRAVACVMKELDVPMCANCGGRGKSGEGLLDERCVKVVHLCANSSCERTVIVRRKLVSQ
jgi:23S rRNA U2552 (ribose-2'-O)-methylase RlmE/FtsJ